MLPTRAVLSSYGPRAYGRAGLRAGITLLTLVIVVATLYPATRPARLPDGLRDYLPSSGRTDPLSHQGGPNWQSAQGFLTVAQGAASLNTDAAGSLDWIDDPAAPEFDGRWLQVNYSEPGSTGEVRTNNYLVSDDRVTLQAVEGPTFWRRTTRDCRHWSPAGRRAGLSAGRAL